ncbi:MAG TPA: guanine deaminase [Burkholderiaceae bacterium]|nr:guanine deaminase [Burkholderiaceae bacterium]
MATAASRQAFRGTLVDFVGDPATLGEGACRVIADGVLVVRDGRIERIGAARDVLAQLAPDAVLTDYRGRLILPGFVDTHIHYAQTDMIASYGEQLLAWLENYTFPTERAFDDPQHAREVAGFFVQELLRNGTTTAMVFATVHRDSVDAIFEAAAARDMCLVAGKVMMDRNCPEFLRDTPASSYEDSAALIARWHGKGRVRYAVTPRFAPTSSDAQLEFAGRLLDEHAGVHFQSHVAENPQEVRWVAELFPWSRSYLDVYDRFGLLRERAVFAHCIHLDEADRMRMAASGAAASFCATSNLFLGSGLFDPQRAAEVGMRVGIGTDVGAGTSFSMLRTLDESYKVAQMGGHRLSPLRAFYLATLGGAQSLYLDDAIGNFDAGKHADFVVLDPDATPLLARRMAHTQGLADRLFLLMTLGDDRAVAATYVAGRPAHVRPALCS